MIASWGGMAGPPYPRPPASAHIRAVLLDAFDTLVALEPPAPRLRAALRELGGVDVGAEAAERGFRAEMEHYLAHHLEGGDEAGLERLRDDCAAAMHEGLAIPTLDRSTVRRAMLASLEFTAFPDAVPTLRALRERGLRLVAVSNWDRSLPLWLDRAGVGELLDGAVSSAVVGAAKPSPTAFRAALELAGVSAEQAVHVGDSLAADVEGARAAGIRAVMIVREGEIPEGVESVRSLEQIPSLL